MTNRIEENLRDTTGTRTVEYLSLSNNATPLCEESANGHISETVGIEMTDDEKIDFVAARILKKYKAAFLELAE